MRLPLAMIVATCSLASADGTPVVRVTRVTGGESTSLKPKLMARKVSGYLGGVRACYERVLAADPGAGGTAVLTLTVNAVGKVEAPAVRAFQRALGACITAKARRWKFPIPTSTYAEPTTAQYQIVFELAPPPPPRPPDAGPPR